MMAWRRDPATGEWVMVDDAPDPMTQGVTGQEPNPAARDAPAPYDPRLADQGQHEGYSNPNLRPLPVTRIQGPSTYPPDGPGDRAPYIPEIPQASPDEIGGQYENVDYSAVDQWVRDVQARGHEIRKTASGTFETDADNHLYSKMPEPRYRQN